MLRSLYAGVSAIKANQVKLDVIGNNIANVGTTAFKGSRVRFQDMVSQKMSPAIAPGVNQGGVNLKQVGLGVQVSGIDTMVGQGMMQPTSRNLDVAMDGEGYLMVGKGLVPTDVEGVMLSADQTIDDANGLDLFYTRDGALTLDNEGNLLNSNGLRVLGYSINDNASATTSLAYDGARKPTLTYIDAISNITTDSKLIPLIIPEKITVPAVGSPGDVAYVPAVGNVGDVAYVPAVIADPAAVPPVVGIPAVGNPGDVAYVPAVGNPGDVAYAAAATLRVRTFYIEKDGVIKAVLEDGKVTALGQIAISSFKNPAGLEKVGGNLYQNTSNSGNAEIRTGVGTIPAEDNSKGYGDMLQGMLEMSNVDLAEQFTDMIITTRSFQAAGKTITTGDEILQEILNLKR